MSGLLTLTDCTVDLDLGVVVRGTEKKPLTRKECALLSYLAARPGEAVTREALLEKVWGYRSGIKTNTVGTTIWSLRSKVERDRRHPDHLLTQRGGGYRFVPLRRDATNLTPDPDLFVDRAEALRDPLTACGSTHGLGS